MFAGLMASRYIRTQRRHSILTVCSISIALALMTMLFTSFSTLIECMRDIAMDDSPYHLTIHDISGEEINAISEFVGDNGKCDIHQINDQDLYWVSIYFERYIDDKDIYIENLLGSARLSPSTVSYGFNKTLMLLDRIDFDSRYNILQYFCLFYIFVIFLALALRLVIDTAFEVSSKERERQFGVLQSIGATPSQIVRIITCEGLLLSVIGIPIGMAMGIGLAFAAYKAVLGSGISEAYFTQEKAAELLHFHISPLMLLIAAVTGLVWVLLSAYGTGMRIIRMSPMQAISNRSNTVKKVKKNLLFGLLFGWKGKLAVRNNRRQLKRYIITVVSLTVSITLFASFSIVMDKIEDFTQKSLTMEYEDRPMTDFDIYFNGDAFDPLAYRKDLQTIRDSGYFTDIDFAISNIGIYNKDSDKSRPVYVEYYSEESYNTLFDGEPPMSYKQLSAQDGFILLTDKEKTNAPEEFRGMESIPVQITKKTNYTEEEYGKLSPEQQELASPYVVYDGLSDTETISHYNITEKYVHSYTICGEEEVSGLYQPDDRIVLLAGTLEQYDRIATALYGNDAYRLYMIYADLADDSQYHDAEHFLENNYPGYYDLYGYRKKLISKYAAVRVGVTFINIMIAMIAIVNMVNILSTGILNRRGEIAAMQCVGMTERQLYSMTAIECIQYSLGAGAVSLMLSEIMMFATEQFLRAVQLIDDFGDSISYTEPLPRIFIAVFLVFIMALISSLIPLHSMQKTPLVDQLRTVD